MMATDRRPPYFPFYPLDFAGDGKVEAMSTVAVGAYILLLCKAWHEHPAGSLPDDDALLARWARIDSELWIQVKSQVVAAFVKLDGRWVQKRMVSEFEKASRLLRVKSDGGKDGAAKRWGPKDSEVGQPKDTDRSPIGSPNGGVIQNVYSPLVSPKGLGSKGGVGGNEPRIPMPPEPLNTSEFRQAWESYRKHLEQRGDVPMTEMAVVALWCRMASWGVQRAVAALHNTVEHGWKNVREPQGDEYGHQNGTPGGGKNRGGSGPASGIERGIAAQRERDARVLGPKPELPIWKPPGPPGGAGATAGPVAG